LGALGLGVGALLLLQLFVLEALDANMDRCLPLVAAGVTGVKAGDGGMPLPLHVLLLLSSDDHPCLAPPPPLLLLLLGCEYSGLASCSNNSAVRPTACHLCQPGH
jgi:hypothetical protein